VKRLKRATDVEAAEWLVASLRDFAKSVLSVVPDGFGAYVRVFHPAYRWVDDVRRPVSWTEIAEANGTRAHAGMQLGALTGSIRHEGYPQPGVFDQGPDEGSLPQDLSASLAQVLARYTTTPGRCWFAVWEGWGDLPPDVQAAPTFCLPGRDYHLLEGPVSAASENLAFAPWERSANLWWPDDRAWLVATEIDFKTTYVGCDPTCADDVLALPDVEALLIDPSCGIDWKSDELNSLDEARSDEER
jgi:hypothetical protein